MAKTSINMVPFEPEKLTKEFSKRAITLAEASRICEKSDGFMKGVIKRGTISKTCLKILESDLHINYNDIKPEEKKKETEQMTFKVVQEAQPEVIKQDLDWKKLYQTIFMASFRAFKAVLEGDSQRDEQI